METTGAITEPEYPGDWIRSISARDYSELLKLCCTTRAPSHPCDRKTRLC